MTQPVLTWVPMPADPRPDLMLLDLNLPGLHGRQVLATIKGDARLRGIPVCIFTSARSAETADECLRLADAYLVKPRTWAKCVDRIRVVLRQLGRCYGSMAGAGAS